MHTSHPPPSHLVRQNHFEEVVQNELSPKMALLHPIIRGKLLQFPEVRLIQYDCGKLLMTNIMYYFSESTSPKRSLLVSYLSHIVRI